MAVKTSYNAGMNGLQLDGMKATWPSPNEMNLSSPNSSWPTSRLEKHQHNHLQPTQKWLTIQAYCTWALRSHHQHQTPHIQGWLLEQYANIPPQSFQIAGSMRIDIGSSSRWNWRTSCCKRIAGVLLPLHVIEAKGFCIFWGWFLKRPTNEQQHPFVTKLKYPMTLSTMWGPYLV